MKSIKANLIFKFAFIYIVIVSAGTITCWLLFKERMQDYLGAYIVGTTTTLVYAYQNAMKKMKHDSTTIN